MARLVIGAILPGAELRFAAPFGEAGPGQDGGAWSVVADRQGSEPAQPASAIFGRGEGVLDHQPRRDARGAASSGGWQQQIAEFGAALFLVAVDEDGITEGAVGRGVGDAPVRRFAA